MRKYYYKTKPSFLQLKVNKPSKNSVERKFLLLDIKISLFLISLITLNANIEYTKVYKIGSDGAKNRTSYI